VGNLRLSVLSLVGSDFQSVSLFVISFYFFGLILLAFTSLLRLDVLDALEIRVEAEVSSQSCEFHRKVPNINLVSFRDLVRVCELLVAIISSRMINPKTDCAHNYHPKEASAIDQMSD